MGLQIGEINLLFSKEKRMISLKGIMKTKTILYLEKELGSFLGGRKEMENWSDPRGDSVDCKDFYHIYVKYQMMDHKLRKRF